MSEENSFNKILEIPVPISHKKEIGLTATLLLAGFITGYYTGEQIKYSACADPCLTYMGMILGGTIILGANRASDITHEIDVTMKKLELAITLLDDPTNKKQLKDNNDKLTRQYTARIKSRVYTRLIGGFIAGFSFGIAYSKSYDPEICSSLFTYGDNVIALLRD